MLPGQWSAVDGFIAELRGPQGGDCLSRLSMGQPEGHAPSRTPAPLDAPMGCLACLLRGRGFFLPTVEGHAIRVALDASVDEVEDVGLWPAVQLGLDPLRVRVLCQLLPRLVHEEKEAVFLRLPHLELLCTQLTHILSGNVRPHEEGLPRAAAVDLLEGDAEVILQAGREKERLGRETHQKQDQPRYPGRGASVSAPREALHHDAGKRQGERLICF